MPTIVSTALRGRWLVCLILVAGLAWALPESLVQAQPQPAPFRHEVIDDHPPERPYYKMIGDIDGDSRADIVVAGADGPLVWYQYPTWQKRQIATGSWDGVHGAIADLDRDGWSDIVMGGIVWFHNPGGVAEAWPMRRIDRRAAHDVEVWDLDQDGRADVVARDQSAFGGRGDTVYLYQQTGPPEDMRWQKYSIACPHGEGLALADVDQDGDRDIVIATLWYENTGDWQRWPGHRYTTAWTEPDVKVGIGDLNGDSRPDIVLTPAELSGDYYKIAWYESPSDTRQAEWTEHVIVPRIETVIHSLAVADFNRDGQADVAAAQMHQGADPDRVFVMLGADRGTHWQMHVLSERGSHDLATGDIDGDGDVDLVGANHAGAYQPIELWRNEAIHE